MHRACSAKCCRWRTCSWRWPDECRGVERDDIRPRLATVPATQPGNVPRLRPAAGSARRSEEHTSELQLLMRLSYAVFCLIKQKNTTHTPTHNHCITLMYHSLDKK